MNFRCIRESSSKVSALQVQFLCTIKTLLLASINSINRNSACVYIALRKEFHTDIKKAVLRRLRCLGTWGGGGGIPIKNTKSVRVDVLSQES
jgi:hypothetical protein